MTKEDLDDIKYVHKNLMEGLKVPLTKVNKETKEFLDKHPEGKIKDLPKELKDVLFNTFKEVQEIKEEKKNQNKDE